MKRRCALLLLAALAGGGLCWLWAAVPSAPTPAAPPARSFAQPVRPALVGTNITATRAFLGAPPVMPHTFAGDRDGRYCLECHAREDRVALRQRAIAPVPHAEFSQCQQCHVNGTDKSVQPFRESGFVGLDFPGQGSRAHPLAPPTIPHHLHMRDKCLSCHGPAGKARIATPHPWRSQCQQCHVAEATREFNRPVPWRELTEEF